MRQHALRQVVSLDLVGDRQLLQGRHQAPVAAHNALDHARVAQVIQASLLSVALPRRIDQGQAIRRTGAGFGLRCQEARFQRHGDLLGEADADEAAGGDRVAVVDQPHRLGRADHLVAPGARRRMVVQMGVQGALLSSAPIIAQPGPRCRKEKSCHRPLPRGLLERAGLPRRAERTPRPALSLAVPAVGDGRDHGVDHVLDHRERGDSGHEPALRAGAGTRAMGQLRFHGRHDGIDAHHALAAGALRLPGHLCARHAAAPGRGRRRRPGDSLSAGAGGAGGRRAGRGRGPTHPRHHHPARLRARRTGPRQRHLRHGRGAGPRDRPEHRRAAGGLVRLALHLLHGGAVLPGFAVAGVPVRARHRARAAARPGAAPAWTGAGCCWAARAPCACSTGWWNFTMAGRPGPCCCWRQRSRFSPSWPGSIGWVPAAASH